MAACPTCGSFLVMGSTCEFCARYGGGAPQPGPQPWQPPQRQDQATQYASAPAYAGGYEHTGISRLELAWAHTRVMWAWILFGAVGGLTLAAYWLIKSHPDILGQLAIVSCSTQTRSMSERRSTSSS